jgi:nucleoside 2-deoxyribosyltransferase
MTSSILAGIRRADLVITDVSRQNSNVLYEIGFAEALRKPILLLLNVKSDHGLPSDLTGLEFIPYDFANLPRLAEQVKLETKALTMRRSA